MIPFSGLIQAVDGSAFPPGANRAGMGNRIHGQQETQAGKDATLFLDDTDGSFLAWVKKLTGAEAHAAVDGEPVPGFMDGGRDPEPLVQLPVEKNVIPTPPDESAGDGQTAAPMGRLTAIIARNGGGEATVPMRISTDVTARDGEGQSIDAPTGQSLSGFQPTTVPEKNAPAIGLTPTPAGGQDRQVHEIGLPVPTGRGGENQGDAGPFSMEVKAADSASSRPVTPAGDKEPSIPTPAADNRLPSALGAGGKGIDPASAPQQSVDAPTKEPQPENTQAMAVPDKKESPAGQLPEPIKNAGPEPVRAPAAFQDTGTAPESKTPADMASPDADADDSRGNTRHSRSQRIAMAEVKETESPKDQPMDSIKSSPVESIKSQPGLQDTARSMAVEPSTTAADRTAAGQAAAMTRTDPSAVKTFQGTVMDQIVDQASLRSIGGRSEVQIRLKPDFLGNVQMNIATDKEQVVVRIITDQPVVKDIIETHLHHLKAELQHQGLTIDKFDVMVSPDADQQHSREQFSQMFKNNSSNQGRRQAPDHHTPDKGNPQGDHAATDDERKRDGVNYFA